MGYLDYFRGGPSTGRRSVFYRPTAAAPQQPEQPGQSRGRPFPERINIEVPQSNAFHQLSQAGTDVFAAAGRYPGQVTETPVALFDRLSGGALSQGVGQSPIGAALGTAGDWLETLGNLTPALFNAQDVRMIEEFGDKPDDFELPWHTGQRADGVPILGAIPGLGMLFSRAKTVGELKRELAQRGFLNDPETGQPRTWQQLVSDVRSGRLGHFDFGYASINDNPLVDLTGRLATDPSNLLFLVPGANVGKAAAVGARIAARAGDVAQATQIVRPVTNVVANMERVGLRAAQLPPPVVAKQAVATGDAANVTMRGMAAYFNDLLLYPASATLRLSRAVGQRAVDPRGYLGLIDGPLTAGTTLGRVGQATARGARGYAKSSAALSASLAATGNIAGVVDEALGGQTFFQGWHDFVLDVENDNPLSESAAWMVASAFSFPYGDLVRAGKAGIGPETLRAFGTDFEPALAKALNLKGTRQLTEALGGPDKVQQLVVYLLKHRAKQNLDQRPMEGDVIRSTPEAAMRASWSDETLTAEVLSLLRENKVSGDDLVEMLRDWHAHQMGYLVEEGGRLVPDPRAAPLEPHLMLRDWKRFAEGQSSVGAILQIQADGLLGLGLRDHVFAETFDDAIIPRLRQRKDSDIVPQDAIRDVMSAHPALAISDPTGFWKNAALPGAKPVTWGSVRRKLRDQKAGSPKLSDEMGPAAVAEARAPRDNGPAGVEPHEQRIARLHDELERHRVEPVAPRHFRSPGQPSAEIAPFLGDEGYLYHVRGSRNFESIRRTGLSPRPVQEGARPAVYFAEGYQSLRGFVPLRVWDDFVALRVRRDRVETQSTRDLDPSRAAGEQITFERVPPDALEYLGSDGAWHPLNDSGILDNDRSRAIRAELDTEAERIGNVARAKRREADTKQHGPEAAKALDALDEASEEIIPDLPIPEDLWWLDADLQAVYREAEAAIRQIDPAYTVKMLPKNDILVQLRDTDPGIYQAIRTRTALGELLFDRGPIAPFTGFVKALFRPVKADRQARAARQALYQRLIPFGAKPEAVDRWIDLMARQAEALTVAPRGQTYRFFRDVSSLPADTINKTFVEAFGDNSKVVRQFGGRAHDVLDMASSTLWRTVRDSVQQGGRRGQLARAVQAWGEFYREDLGPVSDVGRLVGKTFYHWFRFMLDPRWWALNLMERNFLGGVEDGIRRGSRQLSLATDFYASGARRPVQRMTPSAEKQLAAAEKKLAAGKITEVEFANLRRRLTADPLIDSLDSGWYYGRGLMGHVNASFDARRMDSTIAALNGLAETNVAGLGTLRRRMRREADAELREKRAQHEAGELSAEELARYEARANLDLEHSTADLATLLDQKLYEFDQKGVKATFRDATEAMLDAEEMAVLKPLLDVLYEQNETLWRDVNRLYHGNPQRSTIERIANSYWLYWPISYQIKATKWLARVMLDGSFGHDNGALLAGQYAKWHEQHEERFKNNPAYAAMFKENPELWFVAQMILPMTPDGLGVSLSRPVRLAGSWVGLFGEYKKVRGPLEAAAYITNLGPIYTWNVLQDIDADIRGVDRITIEVPQSSPPSSLPAPSAPSIP